MPFAARNFSAGIWSSSAAPSKEAGVSPSITIRISFLATAGVTSQLVAGERAETCVALGLAAPGARGQRGQRDRFEIAEKRDERERRDREPGQADQDSRADNGAAPAQGSGGERDAAESSEHTSD